MGGMLNEVAANVLVSHGRTAWEALGTAFRKEQAKLVTALLICALF